MPIRELNLYELKEKSYVPSKRMSDFLSEAASVCLENQNHSQGVELKVTGALEGNIQLSWEETTQQIRDNWSDLQEATEYGATCIAILLLQEMTDLKVIRRSPKGTGFDYWLGNKKDNDFPFQEKAVLEVSGILKGTPSQVNQRLKEKMIQTEQSDDLKLPVYVIVVEFSTPVCKIAIK
ncbi:MAG: hypothetical protein AAGI23_03010 [Bacteroidota bacterium]